MTYDPRIAGSIVARTTRPRTLTELVRSVDLDPALVAFHVGFLIGREDLTSYWGACHHCGGKGYRPELGGCFPCGGAGEATFFTASKIRSY